MKKLLVVLLALAFVFPSAAAAAPPPPELPLLPQVPARPWAGAGPFDLKNAPDLASLKPDDRPTVPELAELELALAKRGKAVEFVASLTPDQRARIGDLLAANPVPVPNIVDEPAPSGPVLGREGASSSPQGSAGEMDKHMKAMKALMPQLDLWRAAMESGLAGILTPEQTALYQESLLPPPVPLGDVETQSQTDCYYAYLYASYAYDYAYYGYLYAYYSYAYGENLLSYDLYLLAYDDYNFSYYGYIYAYYAYTYYYNATYASYAFYYNFHTMVLSYHTYGLANDIYSASGGTYTYYAYLYEYYKYTYEYYAQYYGYYCYAY
jgi:hypothetical protein